jgi:hypothetical protein
MHIHSVDDPRALYQGGTGPPFPMTDHRTDHPNIERMLAGWVAHDGCPGSPRVAATIRGYAPSALLVSIRVFHRTLEAHFEAILDAIEWGVEERFDLLNLSLGCANRERDEAFDSACARAMDRGVAVVSAVGASGRSAFFAVAADYALEGEAIRFEQGLFHASPWARQRGVLPREKNFHGTSFAVAHVTGIAARLLSEGERSLREALSRVASGR